MQNAILIQKQSSFHKLGKKDFFIYIEEAARAIKVRINLKGFLEFLLIIISGERIDSMNWKWDY